MQRWNKYILVLQIRFSSILHEKPNGWQIAFHHCKMERRFSLIVSAKQTSSLLQK